MNPNVVHLQKILHQFLFVCDCHTYSTKGNEFHLSSTNKFEKIIMYQTLLLAITHCNVIQFHDWVLTICPFILNITQINQSIIIYIFKLKCVWYTPLINQRIKNTETRRRMWIYNGLFAEHVWGPGFDDSELGKRKRSWSRM